MYNDDCISSKQIYSHLSDLTPVPFVYLQKHVYRVYFRCG